MSGRIKILGLRTTAVAAGIVLVALAAHRREPSYQGKPLSYWVRRVRPCIIVVNTSAAGARVPTNVTMQITTISGLAGMRQEADANIAIKTIGTNALPFLLSKLNTPENSIAAKIQYLAARIGLKRQLFESPAIARGEAVRALSDLQPLPEDALNKLRVLSTSADLNVAASAQRLLTNGGVIYRVHEGILLDVPEPYADMEFVILTNTNKK